MLGLLKGENEYSIPPFTEKQAIELLDGLRQIAPYVIVDCGSYIANDILSAVALMEADSVLRLANCDLKSISYFSSQLPLLKDAKWDADKQYKVAANVKPFQAADHIGKVLGSVTFKLPYSQELEEQYLAGNLFSDLSLKDSRAFRKELEKMNGKRVLVVDDVISTGGSLKALDALAEKTQCTIVGQAAVLAEGDAAERKDIIFLEPLPLFFH